MSTVRFENHNKKSKFAKIVFPLMRWILILKVREMPGIKIFRFDAPLYFANVDLFKKQLYKVTELDPFVWKAKLAKRLKGGRKANATVRQIIISVKHLKQYSPI